MRKIMNCRLAYLLAIFSLISGCVSHPTVLSARSFASADGNVVKVRIGASDAQFIKKREIYFALVILNCGTKDHGYYGTPYIEGKRATKFDFPVTGTDVEITATIPKGIFAQFLRPCVHLEGGSYLYSRLKSKPIAIDSLEKT